MVPDGGQFVRCGCIAAQVAKAVRPGERTAADVMHFMKLIQSRNGFFASFSEEVLEDVCQNLEYHPMMARKIIYREGSRATHVYLVANGRVTLTSAEDPTRPRPTGISCEEDETDTNTDPDSPASSPLNRRRGGVHGKSQMTDVLLLRKETVREHVMQQKAELGQNAIKKVQSVVSAMSISRQFTATQMQDNEDPSESSDRPSKPPWIESPEPGDTRISVRGPGRLAESFVDVLQQIKTHYVGEEKPKENFNQTLQRFSARIDEKIKEQLRRPSQDDDGTSKPFVEFNPTYFYTRPAPTWAPNPLMIDAAPGSQATANTPRQQRAQQDEIEGAAYAAAYAVPNGAEFSAGHVFGISACMSGKPHDATARSLERSELLALPVQSFLAAVRNERLHRRVRREQALLNAVPALRALDKEKMERLTECFRSSTHRRGAVLCSEGEVRVPHEDEDRVQFIMEGSARTVKSRSEDPQAQTQGKKDHSPGQWDVGTLLPVQVINGASQFLGIPEPLSVIVDSAEVVVMSAAHADLVRLGGTGVMESLRSAVEASNVWREQHIGRIDGTHNERNRRLGSSYAGGDALWDQAECLHLSKEERTLALSLPHTYSEKVGTAPGLKIPPHDGFNRKDAVRGGPLRQLKFASSIRPYSVEVISSVRRKQCEPLDDENGFEVKPSNRPSQSARSRTSTAPAFGSRPRSTLRRPSVSDAIFLTSVTPEKNLLSSEDKDQLDYLGAQVAPQFSHIVSQLLRADETMRFPYHSRLERLEARGAQAVVVAVPPIDPLHIAAVDKDLLARDTNNQRASTAPADFAGRLMSTIEGMELERGNIALAQTAPISLAPLTPCLPKLQHCRRWRALRKSAQGPTPAPSEAGESHQISTYSSDIDAGASTCLLGDDSQNGPTADTDLGMTFLPSSPLSTKSATSPRSAPRCDTICGEISSPRSTKAATSPRSAPKRDQHLLTASEMGQELKENMIDAFEVPPENSLDMGAASDTLVGSLDAGASDPLAGMSFANLSTMLDESSVWDQMWSVIGSGPSDSMWASQETQAEQVHPGHADVTVKKAQPTLPEPPPSAKFLKRKDFSEWSAQGYKHKWAQKLSKGVPALAEHALKELSPLHVNGIDRFLRKPCAPPMNTRGTGRSFKR